MGTAFGNRAKSSPLNSKIPSYGLKLLINCFSVVISETLQGARKGAGHANKTGFSLRASRLRVKLVLFSASYAY
jgi:hypothetical protein